MPSAERRVTVLDCSGVGAGGITRVLTSLVGHWPTDQDLRLVAVPADLTIGAPATPTLDTHVAAGPGRTVAGRAHVIAGPGRASVAGPGCASVAGPGRVEVVSRQGGGRERTIAAATAALRRERTGRILSLSPSLAVAGARLPVTTIVHDLAVKLWPHGLSRAVRSYRRISYATALRRSQRLLCVSARTRHDLLGLYGIGGDRTEVWHPGSDLPAPGTAPDLPSEYVVVAGHAAHKGVELAIEAMRGFPQYTLVVLTGGARHFADDSGRTVFLDRLDDATYAATVAGARAFLMPSHFEGFGLPAAEALRLGTPTVISPDPALHEATAGAATRMHAWTAEALAEALTDLRAPGPIRSRSWAEATHDLAERLWR